jgi:hypothetical protein
MLDETAATEIEAVDLPEVEAPAVEAPEAEEVIIGFEGEAPAEDVEPETPLIKQLRAKIKEEAKAAREAKARLAEIEGAKPAPQAEPKPTIESCGYDDAVYEAKLESWYEGKAARDAQAKAQVDAEAARQAKFQARRADYDEQKKTLAGAGIEEAEEIVRHALGGDSAGLARQSMILMHLKNPAHFVKALSASPERLKKLAEMPFANLEDATTFTAEIIRMEGNVTVEKRKPVGPESRLPGSAAGVGASVNLAKLQEKARATGDYTEYRAAKRQAEAAGAKV